MNRRILWTHSSDCDFARIHDYLKTLSRSAARFFAERLFSAVERMAEMPHLGKLADLGAETRREYRVLVVDHVQVYYFLEGDAVVIVRIWDTRQDPSRFFLPNE